MGNFRINFFISIFNYLPRKIQSITWKKIVTTELCLHDGKFWPAGKPLSRYCSLGGWGKDTVQKEESYLMDRFVWFLRRSFSLKVFLEFIWSLGFIWLKTYVRMKNNEWYCWRVFKSSGGFSFFGFSSFKHCCRKYDKLNPPNSDIIKL